MAKVGGRVSWIAWPAMLGCIAVIGVLLLLAVPGIPGTVDFIGSTLRGATSAPVADGDAVQGAESVEECRDLYPDALWSELTWTPTATLRPDSSAPDADPALVAALTPAVRFTCAWQVDDGGSIRSTLATVAAGTAPIAQATLAAAGASCTAAGEHVHCEHTADDGVTRVDDLRGDTWLSTTFRGWDSEQYAALTSRRVFGP